MQDSFEDSIFDSPHYTRPEKFEGELVPEVLKSGNHKEINQWRYDKGMKKTKKNRPELYFKHLLDKVLSKKKIAKI